MIRTIAMKEFRSLFATPSTWWMLALMQFMFAWIYLGHMDDYLQVQAQLAQLDTSPGATISIAAPLCNVLALMLMILIPLFTMRLIAEERRNQTWVLLLTAPRLGNAACTGKISRPVATACTHRGRMRRHARHTVARHTCRHRPHVALRLSSFN